MIASASVPRPYSSKRPEATNGASWNGFAHDRAKTNCSGSPTDAIGEPSGATTAIDPRCTDSTRPARVTSTSTGGAAGVDRRPARAARDAVVVHAADAGPSLAQRAPCTRVTGADLHAGLRSPAT